jgi:glycosyltransferase involved in cell wall biosynthesis
MTFAGIYSGLAGFLAKVPTLYYQLATPTPGNPFEFIATQLCTFGGMTLSKAGYDIQSKLYPNKPGKLIYPGVELERFNPESLPSPSECREKLSLPKDRHIIGIVGRLQRWKGMHTVIKAMPIILEKYPDTTCVIVGGEHASEPDYPKYIKSLIAQHNLEDKVVLAGLQSNVQVWMQAMDVIIHASDREPFGIVNIEAMALGKPVVAGSKGGPAEIITQEVNGLLADYDNHEQIANCVIRYFENPEFAIKTAQAAKARASEFSSRQYAINLVNALREFVSDKNE